jgi:hypothetical protein
MNTPFKLKYKNSAFPFKNSPARQKKKEVNKETKFDLGGTEMEFTNKKGDSISPAGSSVVGDIQKIFTDRSTDNLSSSDTLYYNQRSGVVDYYDPESGKTSNLVSETEQVFPFGKRQANKPYLGTKK